MCAYVRSAHGELRTHLSANLREAHLEEGKVSLRSKRVRPKEWEVTALHRRVKGFLEQRQTKSAEKVPGRQDIRLPGEALV